MEPSLILSPAFWENPRPAVCAGPTHAEVAARLEARLGEHDWAARGVLFASSGSTGSPKWILLRKSALRASAAMVNRHLGAGESEHWFLALPTWHVGGFGVAARAFAAGGELSKMRGSWDAARFVEELGACGATCTSLVPTQVHDLVAGGHRAPAGLRWVVVGGGRLGTESGRRARQLGWPVLPSYGMTETASQVATAPVQALEEDYCPDRLEVIEGWEVDTEDNGLLRVKGEALFEGCVREADGVLSLVERPVDGWFTTKDIVDLSGGAFRFVRRADRMVKVLGELVDVGLLERELCELGRDGRGPVIVDVPDERLGRRLIPVVEGGEGNWAEGVAQFNTTLPGYARLSAPRFLAILPRGPLGKPDLDALRTLIAENSSSLLPKGRNSN